MTTSLGRWLAPPDLHGDEAAARRVRLLNAITLIVIGFVLLVILGNRLGSMPPSAIRVIDAVLLATALFWRFLLFRGRIALAGLGLVTFGFFLITLAVARLGTIRTPATATYLIVVIIAGILFGLRGIVTTTIASSLAVAGLIVAENAGILPQPDYTVTVTQWISYTALFGSMGALTWFSLSITEDALERSRKEIDERRHSELDMRKLLRAVEQSPASIVITDLNGAIEYVNPRFTQVTGYSFEEMVGQNPRILKTDQTPDATHRELWEALKSGKEWRGEFVNRKKDGSLYYEFATISPITDAGGVTTHYLAVKEDITEQRRAAEELRASEARWQFALEGAGHGVWDWNAQTNKVFFSPRWKSMLGFEPDEIGDSLDEWDKRVHPDDKARVYAEIGRHFEGETEVYVSEHRVRCKDGSYKWILDRGHIISRTPDGSPLRVIGTHTDISDRKRDEEELKSINDELNLRLAEVERLHEELRAQALLDSLTGLYNRRYLAETLPREFARVDREKESLSVISLDLDHFKTVNDTHGHQAGDEFLVEIGRLLKSCTRGADLVCRHGGEEFLLILPGAGIHDAEKRAEEIRRRCEETILHHEGNELKTTMSLGVATYPEHGTTAEEIITRADSAMYQAKRAGRNRVIVWTEDRENVQV